jgi:hypothetical protein
MAKGALVALTRKSNYTIVELQKELKRDEAVISRMSEIVRTAEDANTFRQTKGGLIANLLDSKRAQRRVARAATRAS